MSDTLAMKSHRDSSNSFLGPFGTRLTVGAAHIETMYIYRSTTATWGSFQRTRSLQPQFACHKSLLNQVPTTVVFVDSGRGKRERVPQGMRLCDLVEFYRLQTT